jgi:hemoglobin
LVLAGAFPAGEPGPDEGPKPSKQGKGQGLNALLRDVINRGADLFNPPNYDHAGCAGLYEGALIAIRPLLKKQPKLQQAVDQGLASARAIPNPTDRAFALRRVLDQLRSAVGPAKKGPPQKKGPPEVEKKGPPEVEKKGPPEVEKKGPPEEKKGTEPTTLWKRLGGEAAVKKVVDDFTKAVLADPQVDFTRGGKYKIDVNMLEKALVELVSQHTGGPLRYTGPDMKEVHKGMHITNREFDLTVQHLKKALTDNEVKPADAQDLLKLVNSTRKAVVEPGATKTKVEQKGPPEKKSPPEVEKKGVELDKKGRATKEVQPPEKGPAPDKDASEASLSGHVTYKGKPLPAGIVSLVAPGGKAFTAPLQEDGTYQMKAVPVGEYVVVVDTASVKPAVKGPPAGKLPNPPPGGPAPVYVPIPRQYAQPETSPLRVSVRKGANNFDLELQ